MKIYCVCQHCLAHSDDNTTIEINFYDGSIYFICQSCKKENRIALRPKTERLPRIRLK